MRAVDLVRILRVVKRERGIDAALAEWERLCGPEDFSIVRERRRPMLEQLYPEEAPPKAGAE